MGKTDAKRCFEEESRVFERVAEYTVQGGEFRQLAEKAQRAMNEVSTQRERGESAGGGELKKKPCLFPTLPFYLTCVREHAKARRLDLIHPPPHPLPFIARIHGADRTVGECPQSERAWSWTGCGGGRGQRVISDFPVPPVPSRRWPRQLEARLCTHLYNPHDAASGGQARQEGVEQRCQELGYHSRVV